MNGEGMKIRKDSGCKICNIIRWYLMIGVPLLVFMWAQPDLGYLRGYVLTNILAVAISTCLICLVAWKYYNEYWRK